MDRTSPTWSVKEAALRSTFGIEKRWTYRLISTHLRVSTGKLPCAYLSPGF